ncbi:MAG: phage tail protein [bacterium]|nr:phage tail protein [bacterium]
MAEPFIGEIRIFAGNFAPQGWAFCNGQLLPIAQNTALFSLIGTTYGGDGRTTTALPNLQGRAPMHEGNGPGLTPRLLGQTSGITNVTLNSSHLPSHRHAVSAPVGEVGMQTAQGNTWGVNELGDAFRDVANVKMGLNGTGEHAIQTTGGGAAHTNMQPYLGLNFIIALSGVFPARS